MNQWLDNFMDKVSDCWQWHSPALQVGFRYITPEQSGDCWEIWAYPAKQELVGGKEDGETVWTGFNFDILRFLSGFQAEAVSLRSRMQAEPPELTVEGKFAGNELVLHVCLEPPDDVEVTEIVDVRGADGPEIREKE